MKSKAIFTISLCGCMAIGAVAAFDTANFSHAATVNYDYPTIFTECVNDNLNGFVDFATDGTSFAFADRSGIVVVKDQERTKYEIRNVFALDYFDGTFYYKMGSNSYSLPSMELTDYEFASDYTFARLKSGAEYEIFDIDGKCSYRAVGEKSFVTIDDENLCYGIKVYNNIAYAFLETDANSNGNTVTVKKLNGTACEDVNPTYIDFNGVEKVSLGTIRNSLKTYNLEKPHFVTMLDGSYYTEVNVDNLAGEYFDATRENTFRCGDIDAIAADEALLILGETGKTAVFSYDGKCFMTHSDNLQPDEDTEAKSVEEAEFSNAYVNAPDWIYSSPYICNSTKTVKFASGDAVKVTGKISSGSVFYRVEFETGDEISTGYVLEELLEPYSDENAEHPDDKNFGVIEDPDYEDEDLVKIVVLLLIVIALVVIGLSYITYVLTTKKKKAAKQAEDDKSDEDNKDEDNKK